MAEKPSASDGPWGLANDERLRAVERDLRAADERFRLLVEGARDFISYRFRLVPDQRFEHVSDGTASILGVPPQRFFENSDIWDELIHPEDRDKAGQGLDPATPIERIVNTLGAQDRAAAARAHAIDDALARPLREDALLRTVAQIDELVTR